MKKIKWKMINIFDEGLEVVDVNDAELDSEDYYEGKNVFDEDSVGPSKDEFRFMKTTPMGTFITDDTDHPLFNTTFCSGATNFDVTEKMLLQISEAVGVEYCECVSRYKFVIGIGEMFDVNETISCIELLLNANTNSLNAESKKDKTYTKSVADDETIRLVQEIRDEYGPSFVAYIFPNHKYIAYRYKSKSYKIKKLKELKALEELSHGIIVDE